MYKNVKEQPQANWNWTTLSWDFSHIHEHKEYYINKMYNTLPMSLLKKTKKVLFKKLKLMTFLRQNILYRAKQTLAVD